MARPVLRTPLCRYLGIEYPIILAGMGGWSNPTLPKLVAAVSEAGGLGVLGVANLEPDEVRARIREVRKLTDKPFGVDTLLPAKLAEAPTTRSEMWAFLRRTYPQHVAFMDAQLHKYELPSKHVENEVVVDVNFMKRQIEVILDEKVPIFAAALGDPRFIAPEGHKQGMIIMGLAGTVRNALRQRESGTDVIIAQGYEAGGHTGNVGGLPLIPQVVDALAPAPVVAAGGISDGRGIAAALCLGAQGVWLGTTFLVADESGLSDLQKNQIVEGRAEDFVVSRAWTGKPSRAFKNPVTAAWEAGGVDPLPAPMQRVLMEDFLLAAKSVGRDDLWYNAAGQSAGLVKARRPAAKIMEDLIEGAIDVLASRAPSFVEAGFAKSRSGKAHARPAAAKKAPPRKTAATKAGTRIAGSKKAPAKKPVAKKATGKTKKAVIKKAGTKAARKMSVARRPLGRRIKGRRTGRKGPRGRR